MATMTATGNGSPARLCVLMPVYNERYRIQEAIRQVMTAPLPEGITSHLYVVDDGSTDGTRDILRDEAKAWAGRLTLIEHERNQGKGAAIRTAIQAAEGDYAIIQDADLEYDPQDYPAMLAPLLDGHADAVYGSRFCARNTRRVLYFWHTLMNRFLTLLSNAVSNQNLTDMETGYKAYRLELLKSIPLRCNRFGIEPELAIKAAKRGLVVYEVPISYYGRSYQEGKKITAWDGVKALGVIFWFWLVDDLYEERYGHRILHRLSSTHRFNRWMADTIRPFVGQRVLEIGSGLGNLTAKILPREHYTASDIDPLHLRHLRNRYARNNRVDVLPLNLEQPNAAQALSHPYDTVICLNVLEHIQDDLTGLKTMYEALAPGGRAIVLVPRGQWLYGMLDRVLGHYRRYDESLLRQRAEQAGFTVEQLFDFNRVAVPGWWWNARLLQRKTFSAIQLKIFDSLVWLFRRVDRLLPWRGVSLIAVLRKPQVEANTKPSPQATPPLRQAA